MVNGIHRRTGAPARGRRVGAVLAAGALVALVAGCSSSTTHPLAVEVATPAAAASQLTGTWPTTTAPKPAPAADPATGLTVSGPFGPPWPQHFTVADAVSSQVPLFESPGKPVPDGRVLSNPTWEGLHLVMLVRNDPGGDYVQVQIPSRPNGATAWVRRSDVAFRVVDHHVVIERGAKMALVYQGDKVIDQMPVAPGLDQSPTPLGSFYVDGIAKPYNPNGPYGVYEISFTGFSDVYHTFGGGVGEVAMHGTNDPALIGKPASHGCVRFTNADITRMFLYAPSGTPVDVVA